MDLVEIYINGFPEDIQNRVRQIRATIKAAAPYAQESIRYGMPIYKTEGKALVYFAGFKHHIGFYATPTGHSAFAAELATYKQGKGSVQFPLDQPVPYDLISRIVKFRVYQNEANSRNKY